MRAVAETLTPAHVLDVLRGNGTSIRFYHRKRPSGKASNAHGRSVRTITPFMRTACACACTAFLCMSAKHLDPSRSLSLPTTVAR